MSAERWHQLNEIFHGALALAPVDRDAFLAAATGADAALRAEALALIEAHEQVERATDAFGPIDRSVEQLTSGLTTGGRLGPYRIIREIGRGGMGAVWLGERDDGQFQQRVAIKLIKRGMDSAQILERFRVERQILASLDHPHIARLLDGGTSDDSSPYFVMEYIEGQPIDVHADERGLGVRERLELFLHVCDAVSYAHRHLVVHRDIKPQNILVTAEGAPKLLDFGIAKVLQDTGEQTLTISGHQLLTPEYASPEQVEGQHTTTQTDVYSLGVVLYELLTGRSPYRPRTWSTPDICASVRLADVERPSAALSRPGDERRTRRRAGQDGEPSDSAGRDRLRGQLRGDLDAIVLTALRKEPERRYGSVEQLASDVRRHLAGLPVRARADSVWYRGAKFLRRNRVAVAAAALVLLTLVGGIVATAWQARLASLQAELARQAQARAERRFADVRQLANVLLFDYHDAIKDLPGATPVRERLVRDALQYLNGLAEEAGSDASLQRELALAYRRVAEVQGGVGASLGDTAGAIDSHRKSVAIFKSLVAARPGDRAARLDVADATLRLALIVSVTADQQQSLALATEAVRQYESLVGLGAPSLNERLDMARAYDTLCSILLESGKPREGLAVCQQQLQLLEAASPSDQRRPEVRRALSVAYQHLGDAHSTFGDQTAALAHFERSVALRQALADEFPLNTDYKAILATAHYWTADTLVKVGRLREALDTYLKSLTITESLAAADPQAYRITFSLLRIGTVLARLGEHERALTYYRRAEVTSATEAAADASNLWISAGLIEIQAFTCASLVSLGRQGAEPKCNETVVAIDRTEVEPTNAIIRASLARSLTVMADAFAGAARASGVSRAERLRRLLAARAMFQKAVAIWADMARLGMLTSSDDAEAATVSKGLEATEAALQALGA
jgi:serine/threonine protein kinase/tetratricopeptide (TPR) repeat protein